MGTKRQERWTAVLWMTGGVAFVAAAVTVGLAAGIFDGPWPLIVCGLIGAMASGITIRVMNRRARQRRTSGDPLP